MEVAQISRGRDCSVKVIQVTAKEHTSVFSNHEAEKSFTTFL